MATDARKTQASRGTPLDVPSPDVAMLVTSATAGVRDSGTAFGVLSGADGASVVTCAHVVSDLEPSQGNLRVNGCEARAITSADDRGIDLAILKVPDLAVEPVTLSTRAPAAGGAFTGLGYVHLHGGQYVSRPLRGTIKQVLTMRAQHSQSGVSSLLLSADDDTAFEPGNSGSAIFDKHGEVIGVLAFASRDGRTGYAISIDALNAILPRERPAAAMRESQADPSNVTVRPLPPALERGTVWDDPNKNRFGGSKTDGLVKIEAILRRVSGTSYFSFDVSVEAIQANLKLYAPARFHLHDTYPKQMVQITRKNSRQGFTLSEVHAYGVFTIGCHVFASDNRWHAVEYDLIDLPELPDVFKSR
jgi:hypothetical protein